MVLPLRRSAFVPRRTVPGSVGVEVTVMRATCKNGHLRPSEEKRHVRAFLALRCTYGACRVILMNSDKVTDEQIESLRTAAGQAGDLLQVAICNRALGEDSRNVVVDLDSDERAKLDRRWPDRAAARRECADVIADAAGR